MSGLAVLTSGWCISTTLTVTMLGLCSGVDLHVTEGEMVGLLGPSGAGKSTLLGLLAGLFRPSAGKINVGSYAVISLAPVLPAERHPALVAAARRCPQCAPLLHRRGERGVRPDDGTSDRQGPSGAGAVLETVGLGSFRDTSMSSLSPGQLQLMALAMAVGKVPGLLLADEPTSQLDHRSRDRVLEMLAQINREFGSTVILVTHDPEVAAAMPRTVTIRDGRIGGEGRAARSTPS